jgi:hypothetical protein
MALVKCKHCEAEIAKSVKKCPQCGGKQGSGFLFKVAVAFIILVVIAGLASSEDGGSGNNLSSSTSSVQIEIPDDQQEFVDEIYEFSEEYSNQVNDLKRSAVRTKRANKLKELFSESLTISKWVGTIDVMTTTGEGNAHIQVKLVGANVSLANSNNELSDLLGKKTLIKQSSPLFTKVADFSKGDQVIIDGVLMTDLDTDEGGDFLDEGFSLTEAGSMTDPMFTFKFTDINLSE